MAKYKLREGLQQFWDPSQPLEENQLLRSGEIKELAETNQVSRFFEGGALELATEEDIIISNAIEQINSIKASLEQKDKYAIDFLDLITKSDNQQKSMIYSWRYFLEMFNDAQIKKYTSEEFFIENMKIITGLFQISGIINEYNLKTSLAYNLQLTDIINIENCLKDWYYKTNPSLEPTKRELTNREQAILYKYKADNNYIDNPVTNGSQYGKLFQKSNKQHQKAYLEINSPKTNSGYKAPSIKEIENIIPSLTEFPIALIKAQKDLAELIGKLA